MESRKVKVPLGMKGEDGEEIVKLDAREGGLRGKERKKGGAGEMEGFYKFQRNEKRRQGTFCRSGLRCVWRSLT